MINLKLGGEFQPLVLAQPGQLPVIPEQAPLTLGQKKIIEETFTKYQTAKAFASYLIFSIEDVLSEIDKFHTFKYDFQYNTIKRWVRGPLSLIEDRESFFSELTKKLTDIAKLTNSNNLNITKFLEIVQEEAKSCPKLRQPKGETLKHFSKENNNATEVETAPKRQDWFGFRW